MESLSEIINLLNSTVECSTLKAKKAHLSIPVIAIIQTNVSINLTTALNTKLKLNGKQFYYQ